MKHPSGMHQRGVTLIELVLVIVIVAIAAVAIMDPFVTSANSYRTNESVQTAAQLAQECAEHLLATRRLQDHATAIATDCPALQAAYTAAGYARTRSIVAAPTPTPCFTSPCTRVDVIVTQSGSERARVVFMLGSY